MVKDSLCLYCGWVEDIKVKKWCGDQKLRKCDKF
jgi:hypothetical protein